MKTMLKTDNLVFHKGISPENKIWKYIKFNKNDKILSDFIDYFAFYSSRDFSVLTRLLSSDNWPAVYIWRLSIDRTENHNGLFRAWVSAAYMWYSVKLCQLQEMKIWNQIVLKVDLYWKGLKLLREDKDLYNSFRLFCTDWLCLWEEVTITRIDYTVDCMKLNFRKVNNLRCRCSWTYYKDWLTKTKYFWKRWHDSAMFIRYYDKKEEINKRWTSMIYPEYQYLPEVMRYELQVNSKWFDKNERIVKLKDLYSVINLWYHISDNTDKHEKVKYDTMYQWIVHWINELKRDNDRESLDKVCIYLDWIYRKNNSSLPIYSNVWGID